MTKPLAAIVIVELALATWLVSRVLAGGSEGAVAPHANAVPEAPPSRIATPDPDANDDHGRVAGEERSAAPAPSASWRPDDSIGVVLHGTVHWRDGTPIAQARVEAQGRATTAGFDGAFALTGLAPGDARVTFAATGAIDTEVSFTCSGLAVERLDAVLDRAHAVDVRVQGADGSDVLAALQAAGAPTRNELLAATSRPGDATWTADRRGRDGQLGTLHLRTPPPADVALLLRHVVLAQQRVEPGQHGVTFALDPAAVTALMGSLTIRVLDDDTGAPLAGARVRMLTGPPGAKSIATDAKGHVVLRDVLPGRAAVEVRLPDREVGRADAWVEPGERIDLGDLRIGAVVAMSGRVVDAAGAPVAAEVAWSALKWRTVPCAVDDATTIRCDVNGTFAIRGAGRGPIMITARRQDGRVAVGVFDSPPAHPVELRLAHACKLTLLRAPASTACVLTLFANDRCAATIALRTTTAVELPAAAYTFVVHDERGGELQRGTVSLGERATTLELR